MVPAPRDRYARSDGALVARGRAREARGRMRRIPAWSAYLAVGLLVTGAYFLLPSDVARGLALAGSLLGALLTIPVALTWYRPRPRRPWLLIGLGGLGVLVGNAAVALAPLLGGGALPFPSAADLLYLGYYPLVLGGVLLLIRQRVGGRDRTGALDAAIATLSAGAVVWAYAVAPHARDGALPPAARLVAGAYPLLDLLLLACALRLLFLPGPRLPGHGLMAAALAATCAADILCAILRLQGRYQLGLKGVNTSSPTRLWATLPPDRTRG